MTTLHQILRANRTFVAQFPHSFVRPKHRTKVSKLPRRHLALFTCMDTRLVEFLEPAMGIERGEAKVIKNAGNSVTGSFESTIRSLLVAIFELEVKEIIVIGHLDCGIAHTTANDLIEKMLARGISADAIKLVQPELEEWIDQFHHPLDNINHAVNKIRSNPLIPSDVPIHGLLFNPHNGEVSVVVDGYEHTPPCPAS